MLSKYRTELMGVAMLWVMFFHASDLDMGHEALEWIRAAGFGGVDIFILLSAMGLALSLSKKEVDYSSFMTRRAQRILPAYYTVVIPYTVFLIIYKGFAKSALIWNTTLLYYWMRS
jgi:peptidoglycan/LPS O-acetylase OafA/YrhL